jgi:hypothetical protein
MYEGFNQNRFEDGKAGVVRLYTNKVYVDLTRSGETFITRSIRPLSRGRTLRIVIFAIIFSFGAI